MNTEEIIRTLTRIKDNINFEVTDAQKKINALNEAIRAIRTLKQERTCTLVKIVATSDISELLVSDKITYLLDKQTMTVYAPWANWEMLCALGLEIIDDIESEGTNEEKIL